MSTKYYGRGEEKRLGPMTHDVNSVVSCVVSIEAW